jgi:crotonobetainyl-CoA:carnitine CoA-transferase CaiB-like acyl-CoA transferase
VTEETPDAALSGVRVLELATVVAGPAVGKYLADFGSDVIKVEAPDGDPTRRMGWSAPGDEDSFFWKLLARNKRCVTLDLKSGDGKAEFLRLLADADLLIENMRPGKLEALGLAPEMLHEICPSLVVLRVTGFGQSGPYAGRPGFATIVEGLSGISALMGEPDGQPLLPPIALSDEVTGLVGAFAALVALRHAERTGEGQVVDVNLLESMFQIMGPLISAYAHLGYLQPRLGSAIPYTVPRGTYRCADGEWMAISCSADSVASRVLHLIGVGDDERFLTFQLRQENRVVLEVLMAEWVAERPAAEVMSEFHRVDAAIAPVLTMDRIFEDPHFREREAMVEVDGVIMQGVVARLDRTPGRISHTGPPPQTARIEWSAEPERPDRSID